MHDKNKISKVDNVPIKTLKVYSPKWCLFRVQCQIGSFCKCHLNLDKNNMAGVCVCADDKWIEGCPLLSNSFIVEKN